MKLHHPPPEIKRAVADTTAPVFHKPADRQADENKNNIIPDPFNPVADGFVRLGDAAFAALAAMNIGFTDIEEEYLKSLPVACDSRAHAALVDLGVPSESINGTGRFGALNFDEVRFLARGGFEFARIDGYGGHIPAIIIPIFNELGDLVDLAAWSHRLDRLELLHGIVPALGLENLHAPRVDGPLIAHANVLEWLRAGRRGVFVIDPARAAERLRGVTLGVNDPAFGRELHAKLTIPPPAIVVAGTSARRVA